MSDTPAISVVMPVYNGERFLVKAIQSILDQSFTDFELLVINDGSRDKSEEIIKSFNDPRVVYVENPQNLGLSKTINVGVKLARGHYIARMDADDIALPNRFAEQFKFLESHREIGIVGSSIRLINESTKPMQVEPRPTTHLTIKFGSLFSTPMYHPSVMAKTDVFKKHHYDETMHNSEDYELWSRLLFGNIVKFANIANPLLLYRVFPRSFTQSLNLDKRSVSAYNTIKNLEHYVKLSAGAKNSIIHLRQDKLLSLVEFFTIIFAYWRATMTFIWKEHPSFEEIVWVLWKYALFKYSVAKHEVKKMIRR